MVLTIGVGAVMFSFYNNSSKDAVEDVVYDRYYVMITDDRKSSFWQSVYEGAHRHGLENNVYVDFLGENLSKEYSREELMRIAIASDVDGIIVEASEGEEINSLIEEADAQGIPVVTCYNDSIHSSRCSFVGVGSYNLGCEYGRMALFLLANIIAKENQTIMVEKNGNSLQFKTDDRDKVQVAILVNAHANNRNQSILYSGIQETIKAEKSTDVEIEILPVTVNDNNAFSVEESIRDIFMEGEVPDIFICLNELSTTCAYQAVVDYNMVGKVSILGYYVSDTIVNAIDRSVIYATMDIDTEQMGSYCVDALEEYHELGYTSQYFAADVTVISQDNVEQYLDKEGTADE